MSGRFDAMFHWWKDAQGNGRVEPPVPVTYDPPPMSGLEPPPTRTADPPWFAQLAREGIPQSLRYPTTTLARILDQTADRFGDLTALVFNDVRWTYRELQARVNRTAGGLSRLGVRKGDHVVMTLPNCPEYVVLFFAIQKLGAVLVNAGPLMGEDDLKAVMALTSPRVTIGLDLHASRLAHAVDGSSVANCVWVTLQSYQTLLHRLGYQIKLWQERERPRGSARHTTLEKLLKNAPAKPPTVAPSPDAIAVLQPTSGTTGAVKLAQLSHRNLIANTVQMAVWIGARDGQERVLAVLPMFHAYGLTTALINPIFCAATIILMTRFEASGVIAALERERPTVFPTVPAICDALSNEIERRERPRLPHPPRVCISGAAPLPTEIAERFERLTGARVVEAYGLSESSPGTHANLLSRPRYGTIGLPMSDTRCRVVDLDDGTRDVPPGQPGEMIVSGPQVMSGYYGNPEATARALFTDDDGRTWLRTGDIVRMDEDGFFQIMDRKKDMIIHSGLKVYPAKVERVLAMHNAVADVAVIGRADPVHTEEVVAVVVLKSPAVDRTMMTGELRSYCRQHLATYEVPAKFEFTDRLPRSALGKLLKKELRQAPAKPSSPTPPTGGSPTPAKEAA